MTILIYYHDYRAPDQSVTAAQHSRNQQGFRGLPSRFVLHPDGIKPKYGQTEISSLTLNSMIHSFMDLIN